MQGSKRGKPRLTEFQSRKALSRTKSNDTAYSCLNAELPADHRETGDEVFTSKSF